MKCKICDKEIKTTFLNKIKGTYVKRKGKLVPICADCQKEQKDNSGDKAI